MTFHQPLHQSVNIEIKDQTQKTQTQYISEIHAHNTRPVLCAAGPLPPCLSSNDITRLNGIANQFIGIVLPDMNTYSTEPYKMLAACLYLDFINRDRFRLDLTLDRFSKTLPKEQRQQNSRQTSLTPSPIPSPKPNGPGRRGLIVLAQNNGRYRRGQ